jgi:5-methyltetrahydrofolate--homocysteine methyltransferase
VDGNKNQTELLVTEFVNTEADKSMPLFMNILTPAIRHLGDLFAARVKFIPHLIAAADAMKAGVKILEPYLLKAREQEGQKRGTVIFATVKGDIHDIGKNICVLMLKNFGYEVIDLGRNVDPELILNTAIEKKAQVVALSALMTTTMMQMKVVIDAVKERKLPFKVVIGGAVVTPDFAKDIQADGYSTDVGTVVSEMERVIALLNSVL